MTQSQESPGSVNRQFSTATTQFKMSVYFVNELLYDPFDDCEMVDRQKHLLAHLAEDFADWMDLDVTYQLEVKLNDSVYTGPDFPGQELRVLKGEMTWTRR